MIQLRSKRVIQKPGTNHNSDRHHSKYTTLRKQAVLSYGGVTSSYTIHDKSYFLFLSPHWTVMWICSYYKRVTKAIHTSLVQAKVLIPSLSQTKMEEGLNVFQ